MAGRLQTLRFGPLVRGVADTTNPSLGITGAVQSATGVVLSGMGQLATRDGTRTVLTLMDDQGTPAEIDAVCAIVPFSDSALAVGWSESQSDVYLYRLTSTLDDWYDGTGALQGTTSPEPIGVLWSSVTTAPDVLIAEGLGVAYIAHTEPVVGTTLTYPTKTFTPTGTIATLQSDLDADSSDENLYFAGVISYQQHLWGWGFGAGTTGSTGYRPELARFSRAIFDTTDGLFAPSDSITLGDRVRSQREGIVGAGVAGNVLFLGAPHALTRVTGYGRDSWHRVQIDKSFGFVGPKCMVAVGSTLYYWSSRGPMRVTGTGEPEPLWDRIVGAVQTVINPSRIVAGYDEATDQVCWAYDAGDGVRARVTYDVRRDAFLGPADDWGLALRCMGNVAPVYSSTATVSYGPSGAPTSASTTSVGATSATANWITGDATALTRVEYRLQGGSTWTVSSASVAAGQTSHSITGLTSLEDYEWRAAHVKSGTLSTYLGPVAGSQFTTTGQLQPPTNLAGDGSSVSTIHITWTNSGESASTEIWAAGPSDGGSRTLRATVGPGVSSYDLATGQASFGSGDEWEITVNHTKSGYTNSTNAGPITVTLP